MSEIFFTSDTHYGHRNIVRGVTDWEHKQGCRDFDTLEEHNEELVRVINDTVGANDILYHLGDWSFAGFDNILDFREKLNCQTVHLILGNHDHHIEQNTKEVQNIFESVQHYKEKTWSGQLIIMSHYAMRVWNRSHRGSIMLYGHSHGTLDVLKPEFTAPNWIGDDYYTKNWRTMDVGIDATLKEALTPPWSLAEIIDTMEDRPILLDVDHHDNNTTD